MYVFIVETIMLCIHSGVPRILKTHSGYGIYVDYHRIIISVSHFESQLNY